MLMWLKTIKAQDEIDQLEERLFGFLAAFWEILKTWNVVD